MNLDTLLRDAAEDPARTLRQLLWAAAMTAGGTLEITDTALAQFIPGISQIQFEQDPRTRTRRLTATGA